MIRVQYGLFLTFCVFCQFAVNGSSVEDVLVSLKILKEIFKRIHLCFTNFIVFKVFHMADWFHFLCSLHTSLMLQTFMLLISTQRCQINVQNEKNLGLYISRFCKKFLSKLLAFRMFIFRSQQNHKTQSILKDERSLVLFLPLDVTICHVSLVFYEIRPKLLLFFGQI